MHLRTQSEDQECQARQGYRRRLCLKTSSEGQAPEERVHTGSGWREGTAAMVGLNVQPAGGTR